MAANAVALTVTERCKLENHETVIESGLKSFVDVGRSLMAIRDERLYRETHGTFEDYCQERWSLTRQHVNRVIAASEVTTRLEPIGSKPETESQARELTYVPDEEQAAVWQEAVATAPLDKAGKPKVTAAHVKATAAKAKEKKSKPKPQIPAKLAGILDRASEFDERCRQLEAIAHWVESTCQQPLGMAMFRAELIASLDEVKRLLRAAKPTLVCKDCKGKGCDSCNGHGLLFGPKKTAA